MVDYSYLKQFKSVCKRCRRYRGEPCDRYLPCSKCHEHDRVCLYPVGCSGNTWDGKNKVWKTCAACVKKGKECEYQGEEEEEGGGAAGGGGEEVGDGVGEQVAVEEAAVEEVTGDEGVGEEGVGDEEDEEWVG
jgi:hypothetical protein